MQSNKRNYRRAAAAAAAIAICFLNVGGELAPAFGNGIMSVSVSAEDLPEPDGQVPDNAPSDADAEGDKSDSPTEVAPNTESDELPADTSQPDNTEENDLLAGNILLANNNLLDNNNVPNEDDDFVANDGDINKTWTYGTGDKKITCKLVDHKLTITGNGPMRDYILSDTAPDTYGITEWWQYRKDIYDIEIGPGITYIGNATFAGCTNLQTVYIPDSVEEIGSSAFANCGINEEGSNKKLTEITIPDSVKKIGASAFEGCIYLSNVDIKPQTSKLENIAPRTFFGCTSLSCFTVPDKTETIGESAFEGCVKNTDDGFSGLETIIFGAGTKKIEKRAFYNSSLTSLTLTKPIEEVGDQAFSSCNSLTNITIDADIPSAQMGRAVFADCENLATLTVSGKMTGTGVEAFSGCKKLETVTFEETQALLYIQDKAFKDCESLTSVITADQDNSIKLPETVVTIGESAFENCKGIVHLRLPQTVTMIRDNAFKGCSNFQAVTIPCRPENIGIGAFADCPYLRHIHIPKDDNIGSPNYPYTDYVRGGETGLPDKANYYFKVDDISLCPDENCPFSKYAVGGKLNNEGTLSWSFDFSGTLTISGTGAMPDFHIETEGKTDGQEVPWYLYRSAIKKVVIANGVTSIGNVSFYKCVNLVEVSIPATVTRIGDYAFYKCDGNSIQSGLKKIVIPDSVKEIGSNAFEDCDDLEAVTLNEGLRTIGNYAFKGCENLNYRSVIDEDGEGIEEIFIIPESTSAIGEYAFQECNALKEITIPHNVSELNYAFLDCKNLATVTIENGLETIGPSTFSGTKINKIYIPDSVTTIQNYAFYKCTLLTSIRLPKNVQITAHAFQDCPLNHIHIPDGTTYRDYKDYGDLPKEKSYYGILLVIKGEEHCSTYPCPLDQFISEGTVEDSANPKLKWSLDKTKLETNADHLTTLTIEPKNSGVKGPIPDYSFDTRSTTIEWHPCREYIKDVVIKDGVTAIGNLALCDLKKVKTITIPKSVQSIGEDAFNNCSADEVTIYYAGTKTEWDNLINVEDTNIPTNFKIVCQKYITEIEINKNPTQMEYFQNEKFKVSGCKIDLVYSTGDHKYISVTEAMIEDFDSITAAEPGLVDVTVKYHDKELDQDFTAKIEGVLIKELVPTKMEFKKEPPTKTYQRGEQLKKDGLLKVYFNNGSSEEVPMTDSRVTIDGYDENYVGEQTLTVEFEKLTQKLTYKVTVIQKQDSNSPVDLYINNEPSSYRSLSEALSVIESDSKKNPGKDYELFIYKADAKPIDLKSPAGAKSLSITTADKVAISLSSDKITTKCNTILNADFRTKTGKPLDVTVGNNNILTIKKSATKFGKVSGSIKNSTLIVDTNDVSINNLTGFMTVDATNGSVILPNAYKGKMSSINVFNGNLKLETGTTATVTSFGNASVKLEKPYGTAALPKLTATSVSNSLNIGVVDSSGALSNISEGTVIMQTAKATIEEDNITVANRSTENNELAGYVYKKSLTAQYPHLINMTGKKGNRDYPSFEKAFEDVDGYTNCSITLNSDISLKTFTLPAKCGSLTINGGGHTITFEKKPTLTFKYPTSISNINLDFGDNTAMTMTAQYDLNLSDVNVKAKSFSISGKKNYTLNIQNYKAVNPINKVNGFGRIVFGGKTDIISSIDAADFVLGSNAELKLRPNAKMTVKNSYYGTDGSQIIFDYGAKPIVLTSVKSNALGGKTKLVPENGQFYGYQVMTVNSKNLTENDLNSVFSVDGGGILYVQSGKVYVQN